MIYRPWRALVPFLLELRCCVGQPDLAPISRVVQLLTDIQAQLQRIGANDEALYSHYQEWCQAISHDAELTSVQLSARVSGLSNEITEQKRFQHKENGEIALATKRMRTHKDDLAQSNTEREREHMEYLQAQQAQTEGSLGPAVEALDRALEHADQDDRSFSNRDAAAKALAKALRNSPDLSLTDSERQTLDGIVGDASSRAMSFLQVSSSRKRSKTLSTLKDVLQTRRAGEDSVMTEERKEQDEFRHWDATVLVSLQEENNEINARKSEEDESEERAGEDQMELDVAQEEAPLSQQEMHSVESECQRRSREFAERKQLRAQEEQTIANAKALLLSATGNVMSGGNGMSGSPFLGGTSAGFSDGMPITSVMPNFLQARSTVGTEVQQHAQSPMAASRVELTNAAAPAAPMPALLALRNFLTAPRQGPMDDRRVSANLRQRMAAALLAAHGQGHTRGDPLQGVRKIVKEMIERLLTEAAEEAEHKAWCEAEMLKANSTQKEKEAEVHRLRNQIRALTAQKQNLAEEVQQLKSDMEELDKLATEAVMERNTEHSQALMSIQGYQSAQVPLQQAIQVLQNFYQQERSSSLLQDGQGIYESQATAGSQAIFMLQAVVDKFTDSARDADAAEKQAARAYDAVSRQGQERMELLQKDIQLRNSGEDHIATGLARAQEDLEGYQKELLKMGEYIEKVKTSCEGEAEGSVARNDRRRAEIKHLQEALKILTDQTSPLDSDTTSGDAAFAP